MSVSKLRVGDGLRVRQGPILTATELGVTALLASVQSCLARRTRSLSIVGEMRCLTSCKSEVRTTCVDLDTT